MFWCPPWVGKACRSKLARPRTTSILQRRQSHVLERPSIRRNRLCIVALHRRQRDRIGATAAAQGLELCHCQDDRRGGGGELQGEGLRNRRGGGRPRRRYH